MDPIWAGERKQRTGTGPDRGFRRKAERRNLYDIRDLSGACMKANSAGGCRCRMDRQRRNYIVNASNTSSVVIAIAGISVR